MTDSIPERLGKFKIIEEIRKGGFAAVYKAMDTTVDRPVALKVLARQLPWDPTFEHLFRDEARVAANLDHPNIVTIYEAGQIEDVYFLAMKLLEGRTLSQILETEAPLPVSRVQDIIEQIASALDYAHGRGLVHRDIKPANILVGADDHVMVMDFDEAGIFTGLTTTGVVFGTPEYMSPEQAEGVEKLDARSDIYSLGVMIYEMLTGKVPFSGPSPLSIMRGHADEPPPRPSDVNPNVSPALEAVLLKALAKNPRERYQSVGEMARALGIAVKKRPMTKDKQVFISHTTEDTQFAHRLADDLQQLGMQVWVAPESIRPGESWVSAIERGLRESSYVVVVLTPAALESEWVEKEIDVAIAQERIGHLQVIPLGVKPCEVPLFLSSYQMISFRRDYNAGLNQLAAILDVRVTPREFHDQVRELVRQAELSVALGSLYEAAQTYERAALAMEKEGEETDIDERELGELFALAAKNYRLEFDDVRADECHRKAIRYKRLPDIQVDISGDEGFRVLEWSAFSLTLSNTGYGLARDIEFTVSGAFKGDATGRMSGLRDGDSREFKIAIKPTEAGKRIPLIIKGSYRDLAGELWEVERETFIQVARYEEPKSGPFASLGTVKRRIESLRRQHQHLVKNLDLLEEMKARYGIDVPPDILNEIDDHKERIERIKVELSSLEA